MGVGEDIEAGLKRLPPPVKRVLKRSAWAADPAMTWLYRKRTGDRGPIPPAVLRARVGSGVRIAPHVGEGKRLAGVIDGLLRSHGTSLAERRVIYDWGCGCGRLLSQLRRYAGRDTTIMGSDVDDEAVAWASAAWPDLQVMVNGFQPPLPVDDGQVDCLVSSSVFTHLTEEDQDAWLAEVARVLAPDGLALITVAGPRAFELTVGGHVNTRGADFMKRLADLPSLDEGGFVFQAYSRTRHEEADFKGIAGTYGLAFHTRDYIARHWSPWLELIDYREAAVNHHQDLLLLRRSQG